MPNTMAGKVEPINISKASTTTNLFYLFFHGGKAAIIPFLTLFFRLIGLNALETGAVIAAKTLTSLVWAPLWARCATTYSRHRLVLAISLFMMIMTYLAFPALYAQLSLPVHCYQESGANQSTDGPPDSSNQDLSSTNLPQTPRLPDTSSSTQMPTVSADIWPAITSTDIGNSLEPTAAIPKLTSTEPLKSSETIKTETSTVSPEKNGKPYLYDKFLDILESQFMTIEDIAKVNLPEDGLSTFLQTHAPDTNITKEEVSELYKWLQLKAEDSHRQIERSTDESLIINKRDWMNDFTDTLHSIRTSLQQDRLMLFLIILSITVGGEIFACPVEKVADDSWFDFLNRIDDLERYGQQRFWGSIAFVVVPVVVTVAVDYTPCFLVYHLHHFLLHFYVFAVLAGTAMLIACCYPVPPPSNGKYSSKICKGLQIICCDGHGFMFSVTLVLTGMVYASHHNFLFWRIQDLGGSETPMGLCVAIGAFAEIPMLILSGQLVKKLGQSWMVCVCLFTLSLRVLYYAFIPKPWAFLPMELTHGITHTALWFAVLSYDDFNGGAHIDRSIRSILSSFYFGVGFSAGSLLSGYIYHILGSSVLFWGCSAVIAGWCLFFSIVQKCLPKKEKVRYIKLLRSDSDNSDDEADDWLEMALKNN